MRDHSFALVFHQPEMTYDYDDDGNGELGWGVLYPGTRSPLHPGMHYYNIQYELVICMYYHDDNINDDDGGVTDNVDNTERTTLKNEKGYY